MAARWSDNLLVLVPAIGLLLGLGARATGAGRAAGLIWALATLPVLAALIRQILVSLRHGDLGLDIVAALSMSAALAVGEPLAAAVVALMYAGGQHLERFAEGRARREMTALLARVPRTAMRHGAAGLEEVPIEAIRGGDRLLIRHGDALPVDGAVADGVAVLDESALTGEAVPVRHAAGAPVMSGPINVGAAFAMIAERSAADSTFAGILRLVEQAQGAKAPMVRLADRWALWFLLLTLLIAGAAWAVAGDPVRAVAVLVVATPCPLILAVPVALVAGLSRAAAQGILIKGGGALETLARIRVLVLDKTGTLTDGRARLVAVHPTSRWDAEALLGFAAALDQASQHSIARALVEAARARGLNLAVPEAVVETAGEGLAGRVGGHAVLVGGRGFVLARVDATGAAPSPPPARPGALSVSVAIDGTPAGELVLADSLRAGTADLLAGLRRAGIARLVLATGDRRDVADAIAADLGLDRVEAGLDPACKVGVVEAERAFGPVMMVGDGVNDAPALAAADLGVAMGARGAAASAETADIVLLVDRLDPILPGIRIARRARTIALQSVAAGIGLSLAAMLAAAAGWITPVQGALLQEAIDVAAILNALRALRPGPGEASGASGDPG